MGGSSPTRSPHWTSFIFRCLNRTQPNPSHSTKNQTQPNPWVDPTDGHLWLSRQQVAEQDTAILPAIAVVEKCDAVVTTAEILKRFSRLATADITSSDHDWLCFNSTEFQSSPATLWHIYVAGHVSRKLYKKLACVGCRELLIAPVHQG